MGPEKKGAGEETRREKTEGKTPRKISMQGVPFAEWLTPTDTQLWVPDQWHISIDTMTAKQCLQRMEQLTGIKDSCFRLGFRFSSGFLPGPCIFDMSSTASVYPFVFLPFSSGTLCIWQYAQWTSVYPSVFLPFTFRDPAFLRMYEKHDIGTDDKRAQLLYGFLSRGFMAEVIYIYIYVSLSLSLSLYIYMY